VKKLYYTSFFYAILGLISGIFYREFTKINDFTAYTALKPLHTHILVLGFLFFLLLTLLAKQFRVHEVRSFKGWYNVYNIGLMLSLAAMTVRGILQVNGTDMKGLSHMAGLGHAVLGASIIWFMILLGKRVKE